MVKARDKRSKNKKSDSKMAIVFAIIIILTAIVSFVAYSVYLDQQDRKQFEAMQQSVRVLHGRLQIAAMPGDKWKLGNSCGQASVKYQEGQIYCSSDSVVSRRVNSPKEVELVVRRYNNVLQRSKDLFVPSGENYKSPTHFPYDMQAKFASDGFSSIGFKKKEANKGCALGYELEKGQDNNGIILNVRFGCSRDTRQAYYPIE